MSFKICSATIENKHILKYSFFHIQYCECPYNLYFLKHKLKINIFFPENPNRELDFTNDVKFDETTQFSEMESSTDYPPAPSPHSPPNDDNNDPSKYNPDDKQDPDDSTPGQAPAPPIVVPTHLPRKQQELLMRVLQHQRLNQANVGGDSPDPNESGEPQVKKEPENEPEEKFEMGIKESEWYTSEEEEDDDEDDNDGQLLKKLQQAVRELTVLFYGDMLIC